jgi:hypothetical protein
MGQAIAGREIMQAQTDSSESWDAAEAILASRDRLVIVRESKLCPGCREAVREDTERVSAILASYADEADEP